MPLKKYSKINILKAIIFYLNIYLFSSIWKAELERERHRNLPSSASFPKYPQQSGLGQAQARSKSFIQVPCAGAEGPSTTAIACCFPRHIRRSLDQKWQCQDSKRTQPSQAAAVPKMLGFNWLLEYLKVTCVGVGVVAKWIEPPYNGILFRCQFVS